MQKFEEIKDQKDWKKTLLKKRKETPDETLLQDVNDAESPTNQLKIITNHIEQVIKDKINTMQINLFNTINEKLKSDSKNNGLASYASVIQKEKIHTKMLKTSIQI